MASLDDAGELPDVDMEQVARRGMLVADDGDFRFQHMHPVEFETRQDAAHGGSAQTQLLRDADAGPASRRNLSTRSTSSAELRRGERCGREDRSLSPARPASR